MVMACGSQGTTQNPKNPGMEPTPTESGHYRNLVNVIPDIREGCETWGSRRCWQRGCFNFQHPKTRDSRANSIRKCRLLARTPPIFSLSPIFLTSVDQVEISVWMKEPELCLEQLMSFFMKWSYSGLTWIAAAAGWGTLTIFTCNATGYGTWLETYIKNTKQRPSHSWLQMLQGTCWLPQVSL